MKFNRAAASFACFLMLATACSSSTETQLAPLTAPNIHLPNGPALPVLSGNNVIPFTVNGSTCSNAYPNKPCVSIKICQPGTSNCQTISDILLDTGSFGLRIFKSLITVPLTQVMSGSNSLAECVQYGDGSAEWGPVQTAGIVLGGEAAVQASIQVIESTFPGSDTYCPGNDTGSGNDTSPSESGFNGILGLGLFAQDCGPGCVTQANNQSYYACNGSTCTGTTVSLANQVTNPVSLLTQDNNGLILELPSIQLGGTPFMNGYLVLGIGTELNNIPSGVTAYPADPNYGEFITSYGGAQYQSIVDSGSNGLFFTAPSNVPPCASPDDAWFCPNGEAGEMATNIGSSGSPSGAINFAIGNFDTLASSNNNVFQELGGDGGDAFDWGLPFFIGRNIYIGLEKKSSSLGTGPYWAF